MIAGSVSDSSEAIIGLVVSGPGGATNINAVVDTGFDGSLSLPPALISRLSLPLHGRGRAVLGDGTRTVFDLYEATVIWDGLTRRIWVDEADTDPLVGMGLLYGYELTIEVVKGGAVAIELLP
ncbi:MAG: clan AA aspartic protease [Acidobacteriota bacterium]